jgi:hypothetical protein
MTFRSVTFAGLLGAAIVASPTPATAQSPATGIPDAPPPIERLIARHDAVQLPEGVETADGRRLAGGSYDLELIQCGGRYFLQLVHRDTRRGLRVLVGASDSVDLAALGPAADSGVSMRLGKGRSTVVVTRGDLAATIPLMGRTTG